VSRKKHALGPIPEWIPAWRKQYAQIEFGALFEQIRAKPRGAFGSDDVVGEYAVYMMAVARRNVRK
jgi:hypothetical protein